MAAAGSSFPCALPHGPQQHRAPMEVENPPLALGEAADVYDALGLDAHALKGSASCAVLAAETSQSLTQNPPCG